MLYSLHCSGFADLVAAKIMYSAVVMQKENVHCHLFYAMLWNERMIPTFNLNSSCRFVLFLHSLGLCISPGFISLL